MSDAPPEGASPRHDPLAALRQPNFSIYLTSRLLYGVGVAIMEAAMAWQTYQISGSALNLGLLGLVRFIPALALTVIGGAVADTYNRRNIVMAAQLVPLSCAVTLALASFGGWISLGVIYFLVMLLGFSSAFEGSASQALLPGLVRPENFGNAVTVASVAQTIGSVSGPFAAGLLIDASGEGAAYAVVAALDALSFLMLPFLRYTQVARARGFSFGLVGEGLRFVFRNQVLLGAMTLDMFAVIFGGAKALLPVYAKDILQAGPREYGLLGGSFEAGAFLMSIALVLFPPIQRTGRALLYVVVIFGIGTIIFGLSTSFWLSFAVYVTIGAADQISVVMRKTTIQLATPDELRGRVTAVSQVFIGASNQLGGLESGLVATLTNPVFAVVSGGIGTLITAAMVARKMPLLWAYRIPRGREALGVRTSSRSLAAEEAIVHP